MGSSDYPLYTPFLFMGHEISAAFGLTLAVVDTRNQMAMNVGMEKKLRPSDRLFPEEIKHL